MILDAYYVVYINLIQYYKALINIDENFGFIK